MDVHPPHEPVHTWRDAGIHLAIMTTGLFIALMLESLVEAGHHRHLLHTAEHNLRQELVINRTLLAKDLQHLDLEEAQFRQDLLLLKAPKAPSKDARLLFNWTLNEPEDTAWDTARDTGAIALMPYNTAQQYSEIYSQQAFVNAQSQVLIREIYRTSAPILAGGQLASMSPVEMQEMTAHLQDTIADIEQLRDLSRGLAQLYGTEPNP